jgi:cytochrome c553
MNDRSLHELAEQALIDELSEQDMAGVTAAGSATKAASARSPRNVSGSAEPHGAALKRAPPTHDR